MVQYVDVESADVHQHLLALTEADALNAEGLSQQKKHVNTRSTLTV